MEVSRGLAGAVGSKWESGEDAGRSRSSGTGEVCAHVVDASGSVMEFSLRVDVAVTEACKGLRGSGSAQG